MVRVECSNKFRAIATAAVSLALEKVQQKEEDFFPLERMNTFARHVSEVLSRHGAFHVVVGNNVGFALRTATGSVIRARFNNGTLLLAFRAPRVSPTDPPTPDPPTDFPNHRQLMWQLRDFGPGSNPELPPRLSPREEKSVLAELPAKSFDASAMAQLAKGIRSSLGPSGSWHIVAGHHFCVIPARDSTTRGFYAQHLEKPSTKVYGFESVDASRNFTEGAIAAAPKFALIVTSLSVLLRSTVCGSSQRVGFFIDRYCSPQGIYTMLASCLLVIVISKIFKLTKI